MRKTKITKLDKPLAKKTIKSTKGTTKMNTHQKTNHEMVELKLHNHWLQEQLEKEREIADQRILDANANLILLRAENKQDRNHSYAISERQERLINKLLDKNYELQREAFEAKREFLNDPVHDPDEKMSVRDWHKKMMNKTEPHSDLKELLSKCSKGKADCDCE